VMLSDLRWVRLGAGLVIALVCLWLALQHTPLSTLGEVLRHAQWGWLIVALVFLTCGYVARIYRWWWMLRASNSSIKLRSCVAPLIVGFAVNNVLPLRAGDVARAIGFQGQLKTPAARVIGSLLLERILDLTVLLFILLVGIIGLGGRATPPIYTRLVLFSVGAAVLCWMGLLF
jgi:uncharacterized protein (TIRG00374 family)